MSFNLFVSGAQCREDAAHGGFDVFTLRHGFVQGDSAVVLFTEAVAPHRTLGLRVHASGAFAAVTLAPRE
jgi:hypothetical protein